MHNAAVTSTALFGIRCALLAATAAMFLLHIVTGVLLRRGVSGVLLLRLEAAYYVVLLAAVTLPAFRSVLIPVVVLGALHLGGWLYAELRMAPAGAQLDN